MLTSQCDELKCLSGSFSHLTICNRFSLESAFNIFITFIFQLYRIIAIYQYNDYSSTDYLFSKPLIAYYLEKALELLDYFCDK
ncbi:TPA: hypothetical protein JBI12_06885 [Legionella pneumophila]|nr:hypothetical protein [Legionella pneumophila]